MAASREKGGNKGRCRYFRLEFCEIGYGRWGYGSKLLPARMPIITSPRRLSDSLVESLIAESLAFKRRRLGSGGIRISGVGVSDTFTQTYVQVRTYLRE